MQHERWLWLFLTVGYISWLVVFILNEKEAEICIFSSKGAKHWCFGVVHQVYIRNPSFRQKKITVVVLASWYLLLIKNVAQVWGGWGAESTVFIHKTWINPYAFRPISSLQQFTTFNISFLRFSQGQKSFDSFSGQIIYFWVMVSSSS